MSRRWERAHGELPARRELLHRAGLVEVVSGILAARGEGLGGNLDDVVDARQGLVLSSVQCQRCRALPHELRSLPEHGRQEEDALDQVQHEDGGQILHGLVQVLIHLEVLRRRCHEVKHGNVVLSRLHLVTALGT